jgi:hypothetical protein
MNPNEQQTEGRIEAVFAALRDAKPAPGMEQRINAALLRADESASISRPRWTWLRVPQFAGVAAVVAAAVLLSIHANRRHASIAAQNRVAYSAGLPMQRNQHSASQESPAPSPHIVTGAANTATLPRASRPPSLRRKKTTQKASEQSQTQQASAEQGFPAPPLPLTEQERLLVRLVHRDDPVQLAQLAPAAREADLQRDREQVREFFKPPPMLAANFKLEPYPTTGGSE